MSGFPGFSLPEGAWLPPELLDILPEIGTLSELKVIIAAIHETLRFGSGGSVISLTDFEALTGLDRKSVSAGIKEALRRGTMERREAGGSFLYRLKFHTYALPAGEEDAAPGRGNFPLPEGEGRGNFPLPEEGNRGEFPPNRGEFPPNRGEFPLHVVMHDTSSSTGNMQTNNRAALVAEMRELGVVLRVAQKLVDKYDAGYLREKLAQARYALQAGIAEHAPGWFVASVREDWQAPLGYEDRKSGGASQPADTAEARRKRYTGGKYKDIIQH